MPVCRDAALGRLPRLHRLGRWVPGLLVPIIPIAQPVFQVLPYLGRLFVQQSANLGRRQTGVSNPSLG
jgi:hypothetical protein